MEGDQGRPRGVRGFTIIMMRLKVSTPTDRFLMAATNTNPFTDDATAVFAMQFGVETSSA